MRQTRNFVQRVGDGADQILHTVTGNGGNRVEFKISPLAKIPQRFKPRPIDGGIQLGGDDNRRLLGEGGVEGFQLSIDDFKRVDRIIGVGVAGVDEMHEEARAFDVAKETNAEAGA